MEEIPWSQSDFHHAKPVYEYFPGWSEDITGVRKFEDLPQNAQDYVLAALMLRQAERRPRLGATLVPGGRLHEGLPAGDGVREPLDVF